MYPRCRVRAILVVSLPAAAFLLSVVASLRPSTHVLRTSSEHAPLALPLVVEFHPEGRRRRKPFDNEDARLVGFPARGGAAAKRSSSTKIIHLATPFFSEWNPKHFYFLHSGNETFSRYPCAVGDCRVTREPSDVGRADAVLFHLRDLEVYGFPRHRSPHQTWILYSMEPPWLEVKDVRRFDGVFNWTMSYRRDSDVVLRYGFVGRRPGGGGPRRRRPSGFGRKRDAAVWFVSNCRTDSNRERYVERLMKTYPVRVVGGCGEEGCRPAETGRCYAAVAERYKFYLAFENAICRDYVTEKLFNPLEYDVVPVVLGGADYSSIAPRDSLIDAMKFRSPEDLGEYLWRVSRNETLYVSYLAWKETYRSYLQPWMCDLCEKLHDPPAPRTRRDLDRWWREDGSCKTWTADGFKPVQQHPFPVYHVRLFD